MTLQLLEFLNISKTFQGTGKGKTKAVEALKDVSFKVNEGEVFALIGPNGSGKTTAINIISGLIRQDKGQVIACGKAVDDKGYLDKLSFVSSTSGFYWSFTGRDILEFYRNIFNTPEELILTLAEDFGMLGKLDRQWESYSLGEMTRLKLIKALLSQPRILFLDEPTVGLDPDAQVIFREKIKLLKKRGITILLTSHYMRDIEELADRIGVLFNGKLVAQGVLDDFVQPPKNVRIEFNNPRDDLEKFGTVEGNSLVVKIEEAQEVLKFGGIASINTIAPNLEDYFIGLVNDE